MGGQWIWDAFAVVLATHARCVIICIFTCRLLLHASLHSSLSPPAKFRCGYNYSVHIACSGLIQVVTIAGEGTRQLHHPWHHLQGILLY